MDACTHMSYTALLTLRYQARLGVAIAPQFRYCTCIHTHIIIVYVYNCTEVCDKLIVMLTICTRLDYWA